MARRVEAYSRGGLECWKPANQPWTSRVSETSFSISLSETERLERLATKIACDEPAHCSTGFFDTQVAAGMLPGPATLIGDIREITLTREGEAQNYEYRISHLAADGDIILLGSSRNASFEAYRQEVLGLGSLDTIELNSSRFSDLTPLATRCISDSAALDRVTALAKKAGAMTLIPHIGRGSVWQLAAVVAQRSGVPICVAAPPPRLTTRINDKVWFAHRAEEVLGPRAQPPFHAAFAVQIWIASRRSGPPIVEGIFEQVVAGLESEFAGSVPATFPDWWAKRINEEALKLATLFQFLGYFGRCSFDALVVGHDYSSAVLHWLECNGRWGGVSIPMTLANRLTSNPNVKFVVVQRNDLRFQPRHFSAVVRILEPILFRAGQQPEGVVLLSPQGIELGNALQLMSLSQSYETAIAVARQASDTLMSAASQVPNLQKEIGLEVEA